MTFSAKFTKIAAVILTFPLGLIVACFVAYMRARCPQHPYWPRWDRWWAGPGWGIVLLLALTAPVLAAVLASGA